MTSPQAHGAPLSLEFDDIIYALQPFGGITEYWREITSRICRMSDFEVHRRHGTRWGRMRRLRSTHDVFHSSYYRTARGPRIRTVSTVHDMAYELGFVGHGARSLWHRVEHRRAYFASDALICVSASTRDDLLRVYPALAGRCPIFVVPHGVTRAAPEVVEENGPSVRGTPYVLFVGGRRDYKNFDNALLGFAASGLPDEGFKLLCTGAELDQHENRRIGRLGLTGAVRSVGKVERSHLARLYTGAYCLLYPSLFEGFGLPMIEAMQMGCPVVAADRPVTREVAGNAALLVDALDPTAIGMALIEAGNPERRLGRIRLGLARAAEYSWDRSAHEHATIYHSLV